MTIRCEFCCMLVQYRGCISWVKTQRCHTQNWGSQVRLYRAGRRRIGACDAQLQQTCSIGATAVPNTSPVTASHCCCTWSRKSSQSYQMWKLSLHLRVYLKGLELVSWNFVWRIFFLPLFKLIWIIFEDTIVIVDVYAGLNNSKIKYYKMK